MDRFVAFCHARLFLLASMACINLPLAACLLGPSAPAGAQTCPSFRTCEEAMRSFHSGNTRLDGDKDGIPCEKLCGNKPRGSGSSSAPAGGGGSTSTPPAPAPALRPSRPSPSTPLARGPVTLISVGDGDTIRVRTLERQAVTIRLACIDAPETAQGEIGTAATRTLKHLLAGVSLELEPQTLDRYGRTVAEVYANGRNVNLALVQMGVAYVYRQYLSGCDRSAYLAAEAQAENRRLGVWRWGGRGQRPWDFRRR